MVGVGEGLDPSLLAPSLRGLDFCGAKRLGEFLLEQTPSGKIALASQFCLGSLKEGAKAAFGCDAISEESLLESVYKNRRFT